MAQCISGALGGSFHCLDDYNERVRRPPRPPTKTASVWSGENWILFGACSRNTTAWSCARTPKWPARCWTAPPTWRSSAAREPESTTSTSTRPQPKVSSSWSEKITPLVFLTYNQTAQIQFLNLWMGSMDTTIMIFILLLLILFQQELWIFAFINSLLQLLFIFKANNCLGFNLKRFNIS